MIHIPTFIRGLTLKVVAALLLLTSVSFAQPECLMPPYRPDMLDSIQLSPNTVVLSTSYNDPPGLNEPGIIDIRSTLRPRSINGLSSSSSVLPAGFRILVLCPIFPDKNFSTQLSKFDSLIFYPPENLYGPYSGPPRSVSSFYYENTNGDVTLITLDSCTSVGAIMMPQSYSYYVNNAYGIGAYPNNTQKLTEDLISLANPFVNYADYDNDGNGYVDGIVIIHPGRGAEFSGSTADIWSHKWGTYPRRYDDIWISAFSIQPEFWNAPGDMTIGVYAHEIGHLLGLPDLYDTDNSSRGLGKWDCMAGGSWNGSLGNNPAPFGSGSHERLGTKSVITLHTDALVTLDPEHKSRSIVQIPFAGTTNYFYLVSNRYERTSTLWQSKGLLIYRIDKTKTNNTKEWYPGKETLGNYREAIIQRNNLWSLEKNTASWTTTDTYQPTAATFFGPYTKPSANWYDGTKAQFKLYDLRKDTTGRMSFKFEECSDCPNQLDYNADGLIDYGDIRMVDSVAFRHGTDAKDTTCPYTRTDINCSGATDIFDVIIATRYWTAVNSGRIPSPICRSCR